ncbi:Cytochrome c-type biogenesis protein CcmC, putative heme lyase for CcmE [Desulfosporosinus sp. I2]|uniref:cytochrome c biogenesis protein n=1 Tax=Desulfosporosinus sp. I2 TaxID=1617025 RepID=UPI0005F0306E|nr:cytochrome c biogenesis protein CcsA [Desulfosporosinus sp. I2]KJR46230.1 Cytochrome c-type biogenesis protein CcmC, putative heme lyase for CcmE [Desulfosporosinus sp. I2]
MTENTRTSLIEKVLAWSTFLTVFVALYLALVYAPTEKTMGDVQRIFYFHVASAWVGMMAFLVVFVASIAYLLTRQANWDIYAYTSAEIGVFFTTIVLITGPIWAKPIWNTWWTWDPRLTTTLILWFLYLAYGKIRLAIGEEEKKARLAAVFGILAFAVVPVDFFAIRWWRTMHPGALVTSNGIALAPDMMLAFFASLFAFTLLYCYLMMRSVRIERIKAEIRLLKEGMFN